MQRTEQKTRDIIGRLDKAGRAGEVLAFLCILGSTVAPGFGKGLGYVVAGLIIGVVVGVLAAYLLKACVDWMKCILFIQSRILSRLEDTSQ